MSPLRDLLAANEAFAQRFTSGGLDARPRRHLVVLTCMDARIDALAIMGLDIGDAHILRNAGGRASDDAIRSLAISTTLLGTDHVLVVHHTRCGMIAAEGELERRLRDEHGIDTTDVDLLPITDPEASVRADVAVLRESALIPSHVVVSGLIYDVDTGRLRTIEAGD